MTSSRIEHLAVTRSVDRHLFDSMVSVCWCEVDGAVCYNTAHLLRWTWDEGAWLSLPQANHIPKVGLEGSGPGDIRSMVPVESDWCGMNVPRGSGVYVSARMVCRPSIISVRHLTDQ